MADVHPDSSPRSAPAIISYIILGLFTLTVGGIFIMRVFGETLDSTFSSIIGQIVGIEGAAMGAVGSYWLASSLQANRANAAKDAVIAQLGGAGPPPPAPPVDATGQATASEAPPAAPLRDAEEPPADDAPPAPFVKVIP